MKMVIVQNKNKWSIALRDDGTFVKIPQRGYRVGQTIEPVPVPNRIRRFPRTAIAAAIAIVLLSGSGALAVRMPYSYVTMDVNPSIKYAFNIFDRLLSVSAINTDAEPIVKALNRENIGYLKPGEVIDLTIKQCRQDGYLDEGSEDYVVLSVAAISTGKTDTLSRQLEDRKYDNGFISTRIVSSTIDALEKAEKRGTTPGKLEIIEKVPKNAQNEKTVDEWIHTSVKEIIRAEAGSGAAATGLPEASASPSADDRKSLPSDDSSASSRPKTNNGQSDTAGQTDDSSAGQQKTESDKARSGRPDIQTSPDSTASLPPKPDNPSEHSAAEQPASGSGRADKAQSDAQSKGPSSESDKPVNKAD